MAKRVKAKNCRVPGCPADAKIKDFCPKHYARFKKYGLKHMLENHYKDHEDYSKYVNRKFNRWKVLKFIERKNSSVYMQCICTCGTIGIVQLHNLKAGVSKGCKNCKTHRNEVHGLSKHPCYAIWHKMMCKCYDTDHPEYAYFGKQGVTVCKRWHNVKNFIEDISVREYGKKFVIISPAKGYSPKNVAWLTTTQITDIAQAQTHRLTASLLGRLTGYSRERINQLTNTVNSGDTSPILEQFIDRKENKTKYTIVIYNPSAIKFLRNWKKRIHKNS